MMIWDAATIFILGLTAVYCGFFIWIEVHSRRNQNKVNTYKQDVEAEPMEQVPQTAAPPADIAKKRRHRRRLYFSSGSGWR